MDPVISRRHALIGGGLCALAASGLAGCASYGPEEEPAAEPAPAGSPAAGGSPSPGGSRLEVATSEIPVGGGKVYDDAKVVLTQPSAGEYRAFTAVCTHAGCTVAGVSGTIDCGCHGSKFSIRDGSVVNPPAQRPLAEYAVSVSAGRIVVT